MPKVKKNKEFDAKLEKALRHYYDTIDLVDYLLREKRNAQEIILLTCSRLDSLANILSRTTTTQKTSFIQFLSKFSGESKFFNKVSVGDLYNYLYYYGSLAEEGLIERPGRIRRFGKDSDDFLLFIEWSNIPVTAMTIRHLSHRITKILETSYRVKLGQKLSKQYISSVKEVEETILKDFKIPPPEIMKKSVSHLLERFKISSIFYEKYRCGVIHGFKIQLSEKEFFSKSVPYHGAYDYLYGTIFNIEFPGKYLRELLYKSLNTLSSYIKTRKKLPAELLLEATDSEEMFEGKAIELYLDDDSLDEFEEVKWQIRK
jgi:hypothetical protein